MISTQLATSVKKNTGTGFAFSQTEQIDGSNEKNISATIAAASTDAPIHSTWPAGQLLAVLLSDQDCTIKTNNTSTPDDTIVLKANHPLVWVAGDGYFSNPFSADVTEVFVTTTIETNLQVYLLS
jgi:hypothetical protein